MNACGTERGRQQSRGGSGDHRLGGELRPERPGDLDLAARLHCKRKTERTEVDLGLACIDIREAGGSAKFHLPRQCLDQIHANRSLTGQKLALDINPTRSLRRALTPPGVLDRQTASSGQPMARKTTAHHPGEINIEQLTLKESLPVREPSCRKLTIPSTFASVPSQSSASKNTLRTRAGNGMPSTVLKTSEVSICSDLRSRVSVSSQRVPAPAPERGKRV